MTTSEDQRNDRLHRLQDEIFDAVSAFELDYDRFKPRPEDGLVRGRRLRHLYRDRWKVRPRSPMDAGSSGHPADGNDTRAALDARLHRKRERWLELWGSTANMIAEFEAEHVRAAADDADWASMTAKQMRERLAELLRSVQIQHPDMPDVALRPDATGKHRPVMSAVDTLEAFYFAFFEDDNNYVDKAKTDIERARRAAAGRRLREWIDFKASGSEA